MSEAASKSPRWRGLEPFLESDQTRFHGRGPDIADLVRRVSQRRLTILFGQSGLGKTSLLRAGLFPELRKLRLLPVYLRITHGTSVPDPITQVREALGAAIGVDIPRSEELSAWCHDQRHGLAGGALAGIVPVLVFDQFEEVFTLGQATPETRGRSARFLRELSDLAEARPPSALEAAFESQDEDPLDYDFETSPYRIIISIREDYLSHLERCRQSMPSLMENRQPLDRLGGNHALEAVLGPGEGIISRDVAEAVVRFVSGDEISPLHSVHVEPPLLSLVCQQLDHSRGDKPITAELLGGKREEILESYYQGCFEGLRPSAREAVEDLLVTESGFRENIASETLERAIGANALRLLESRRLIHGEAREGRQRVELTHDVLTKLVVASRSSRRERKQRESKHAAAQNELRRKFRNLAVAGLGIGLVAVSTLTVLALKRRAEAEEQKNIALEQTKIAEEQRENAEALRKVAENEREKTRTAADALGSTARNLTAVLIGTEKGTVGLTTDTLVRLLPRMEALQIAALDAARAAGENTGEAYHGLFDLHRLAAEAYGRNEILAPAVEQTAKARALLENLPENERLLSTADIEILEAEIRLGLIIIENGTLTESTYSAIADPLHRALGSLENLDESHPDALARRWRWLKASNLLARLDRHQKKLDASRERYTRNLALCGQPFAGNVMIRRMKAEALNGIANLKVYRIDHFTVDPTKRSDIEAAIRDYRLSRELRQSVLTEFPDDVWVRHELALTLENLASALMIIVAIDTKENRPSDPSLTGEAIDLRKERLAIHHELHEIDPGNRLFAVSYAYAIANLVRQEAIAPVRPGAPPDPARWFDELAKASIIAPNELKIAETRLEVLVRYKGSDEERKRVRSEVQRLREIKR